MWEGQVSFTDWYVPRRTCTDHVAVMPCRPSAPSISRTRGLKRHLECLSLHHDNSESKVCTASSQHETNAAQAHRFSPITLADQHYLGLMAPALNILRRIDFSPDVPSDELSNQWTHPSDVFSVLLILGGDVVARALAQSTGSLIGIPSFSFGRSS